MQRVPLRLGTGASAARFSDFPIALLDAPGADLVGLALFTLCAVNWSRYFAVDTVDECRYVPFDQSDDTRE
jgi:hypothetical protein